MLLNDNQIRHRATAYGMIEPFEPGQVKERRFDLHRYDDNQSGVEKIISYGTSSYGYDVRAADEWRVFSNVNNSGIVDPKNFNESNYVEVSGKGSIIIPPNSFVLGRTVEYFRIPRDVLVVALGKSTYARCGIIVNVTPLEPEWEGHVTLEFSNTTPLPAKIYANEGVAQFLFLHNTNECAESYRDRNGKYQGQTGITNPKV